jgi:cold shock CspA family protein
VWNREFEKGIRLIEPAVRSSDGKAKLIAVSSLAQAYRRWAESARDQEHNPVLQYRRALQGLTIALASLETGVADRKIRDIAADCPATMLQGAASAASDSIVLTDLSTSVERLAVSLVRFVDTRSWPRLQVAAARLSRMAGVPASIQRLPQRMAEIDPSTSSARMADGSHRLYGEVVNLKEGYGFIRHPSFPRNVFFHLNDAADGESLADLNTGALVSFTPQEESRGPRACAVRREA